MTSPIVYHLLESTALTAFIALLAYFLRQNHAKYRFGLWLAASIKFLIPFSMLVVLGEKLGGLTAPVRVSSYFAIMVFDTVVAPAASRSVPTAIPSAQAVLMPALVALWCCGFVFVSLRWLRSWFKMRTVARQGVAAAGGREFDALRRVDPSAQTPILLTSAHVEPGVFGILRPVLLWPQRISPLLADEEMEAIMAHELSHIARRDNLCAFIHMLVEAIFWFHPLVWWLGRRLVEERELACDEAVLTAGGRPRAYAEGIVKTCRFFVEHPLACVAGVTGADLKLRIERIMKSSGAGSLNFRRKLLIAASAFAVVLGPLLLGMASAPPSSAQSPAAPAPAAATPSFEVASIKPNHSADQRAMFMVEPGGRLVITNGTVKFLIAMAYKLKPNQISGGPSWLEDEHFDITAKSEKPADPDQMMLMVQSLLKERFNFAFHNESKESPIYSLVVAKNGPKLKVSTTPPPSPTDDGPGPKMRRGPMMRMGRGEFHADGAGTADLANALSNITGRNVVDHTGLTGTYDVNLTWTPDPNEGAMFKGPPGAPPTNEPPPADTTSGPSIFTALQEQLGLKLESAKGPVVSLIIDHIDKPSEN